MVGAPITKCRKRFCRRTVNSMTKVDQFESVFKSAAKTICAFEKIEIARILVLTDKDVDGAAAFADRSRALLRVLASDSGITWRTVEGDAFFDVGSLLELVDEVQPDLICTYRHLHSDGWKWPFSLGAYLDILLQQTPIPVVVLPHPDQAGETREPGTLSVMAVTDHLPGDDRLFSMSACLTEPEGTLHLVHVEDEGAFQRFMDIISKISSIDTDQARDEIRNRMMKEPRDYVTGCRAVMVENGFRCQVEETITMGRQLSTFKNLLAQHAVDLLVMNTKDHDQLAMHGLAYPLAVELRETPLLML